MIPGKILLILAAAFAVPATTADNCNGFIGNCFKNDCAGIFSHPSDTIGTCTEGTYNGCPCEKCGGQTKNPYTGPCDANGCDGLQGICQAGQYQGCTCKTK